MRHAGKPQISASIDETAGGIEGPASHLADRAEAHEFKEFLTIDEAVDVELGALVQLPDADEAQVRFRRQHVHPFDRPDLCCIRHNIGSAKRRS